MISSQDTGFQETETLSISSGPSENSIYIPLLPLQLDSVLYFIVKPGTTVQLNAAVTASIAFSPDFFQLICSSIQDCNVRFPASGSQNVWKALKHLYLKAFPGIL